MMIQSWTSVVSSFLLFAWFWRNGTAYTIQVCQNKDCCKRFQGKASNLVQTLEQLLPSTIQVETTGCLSNCGKGPNICLHDEKGKEEIVNGVANANSAAAVLEIMNPDVKIHPTVLAAVNVMEKSLKVGPPQEKERFLSSVVGALEKNGLSSCRSMAFACAMRAETFLEQGELRRAREDATRATELCPSHPTAWRTLADVEEADGNLPASIAALSEWARANPSFHAKVSKEIQRLKAWL